VSKLLVIAADLVAITLLTFGVYFPRHHRRDLVVAFLGVNCGVLAASIALGASTVSLGMGLGLFGVLSIIRLRSYEIAQHEIAYYFAALALGLLGGLSTSLGPLTLGLMALVIAALFVGDHPWLFRRYREQTVRLDGAYVDEEALRPHLEAMLNGRVVNLSIKQVDLVNDTTLAEVRYIASRTRAARQPGMERVGA
jgi:hypothetical protein